MDSNRAGPANELDFIRRTRGAWACESTFRRLCREHREIAVWMINDSAVRYATLYILRPEIAELHLEDQLNERNRAVLALCEKITEGKAQGAPDATRSFDTETIHAALMWMFQTGLSDDGLSGDFDQTLDIAASVLIKSHHEKTILPDAAELIFRRNRKGAYLHDLIWAYFQSRDAESLRLIAGHLISPVRQDEELAATLLHLPAEGLETERGRQKKYKETLSWIDENSPYLYFTGESFQRTNSPVPCSVDLGAKYLNKKISPRSRQPLSPLTAEERSSLTHFRQEAPEEDKTLLAKYSHKLHEESPGNWAQWLQSPVSRQIEIAKNERGEQP